MVVTLLPVALAREFITFGIGHGLIRWSDADCLAANCSGIGLVVFMLVLTGMVTIAVFAILGAITARWRARRSILAPLWLCAAIQLFFQTANGYRQAFGNTCVRHEPFRGSMFFPMLTLSLLLGGMVGFWKLTRPPHGTGTVTVPRAIPD